MREIVALSGRTEGDVVETSDIFHSRDGVLVRTDGFGFPEMGQLTQDGAIRLPYWGPYRAASPSPHTRGDRASQHFQVDTAHEALTYAVTDGVTDEVFHPWPTWPPQSATRADRLTTRVEPSTTEADPMPAWTITDARTGMAEVIEADRIEDDGNGWSWWLVVVIVNRPRWACIRRVAASDVAGEPVRIGGQPWTPG